MSVSLEPKTNTTQTRFPKTLVQSALWSGHDKVSFSVLLLRKTGNLASLDADSITSISDFVDVK